MPLPGGPQDFSSYLTLSCFISRLWCFVPVSLGGRTWVHFPSVSLKSHTDGPAAHASCCGGRLLALQHTCTRRKECSGQLRLPGSALPFELQWSVSPFHRACVTVTRGTGSSLEAHALPLPCTGLVAGSGAAREEGGAARSGFLQTSPGCTLGKTHPASLSCFVGKGVCDQRRPLMQH